MLAANESSKKLPVIEQFWILLVMAYKELFTKDFMSNGSVNEVIENALKSMWVSHLKEYSDSEIIESTHYWIGVNGYPPKINELIDVIKMKRRYREEKQLEVEGFERKKLQHISPWSESDSEHIRGLLKKAKKGVPLKDNQVDHPVYDKESITIGHPKFNEETYQERRKYLISLDEYSAANLSIVDRYDRGRFLREEIGRPIEVNFYRNAKL